MNTLVDMNATNAAVRAGYSPKTAKAQASRLLTFVNVNAEIKMRQKDDAKRLKIGREMVLAKLGDAIELARVNGDPRTMISAAAEIAKMMGYYRE